MTVYGGSTNELLNWAGNTKPVLGKHYYLLYLKKAKQPCSAQMFHEVLKDHYKPSLAGYSFTNKVPDYCKFYQKLFLKMYFDYCTHTEQLANYSDYLRYCKDVYESVDCTETLYQSYLLTKKTFHSPKAVFNRMMLKD